VIGLSGVVAGMGDTENARLDGSVKHLFKTDLLRVGVFHQSGYTDSSPGGSVASQLGLDFATSTADPMVGFRFKSDARGSSAWLAHWR
jgi:hypothetical protein